MNRYRKYMWKTAAVMGIVLCIVLAGCGQSIPAGDALQRVIIPASYWEFSGIDTAEEIESAVTSLNELGDEYITEAFAGEDGSIVIVGTKEQLSRQIDRNNEYTDRLRQSFLEESSAYSFEGDTEYAQARFYFDKNCSELSQAMAIAGTIACYGLNGMLKNETSDWIVKVEVYNCRSGKLVAAAEIPDEELSFGEEEWRDSE